MDEELKELVASGHLATSNSTLIQELREYLVRGADGMYVLRRGFQIRTRFSDIF